MLNMSLGSGIALGLCGLGISIAGGAAAYCGHPEAAVAIIGIPFGGAAFVAYIGALM